MEQVNGLENKYINQRLLSLSCSGESIEKVLTLYYHTLISNSEFYNKYRIILFYGNNLPKKNKELCAHGTLAFYDKYFSDISFIPPCTKEFYWEHSKEIVDFLSYKGIFTQRQIKKIEKNEITFWDSIKWLPFYYLYPRFMSEVIRNAKQELNIYKLESINFEQNYIKAVLKINKNRDNYSIYGLSEYGKISHFYLKYTDINEQSHLLAELNKQNIMSGNSAMLIQLINSRIGCKTIVGYRNRKNSNRPNREIALKDLIYERITVQEPKNIAFNMYYDEVDEILSMEEKANIAIAKGYRLFLLEKVKCWNIDRMQDELFKGKVE